MQVIIPMSGIGQRFIDKGYNIIKPLISVEGKPIIEHIINRFSKEDYYIFICNEDHLKTTELRNILENFNFKKKIISIKSHKKGPVNAVLKAKEYIDLDQPTIVNYCDFSWRWDYQDFKKTMKNKNCDGCVISYKGFHPHLLRPNLYASMRVDNEGWMKQIREKYSFTNNKMNCYQSSGTYYFKNGNFLINNCKNLMKNKLELNGEYYISLVYNELIKNNLRVFIYEIPFFLQWGTPDDLKEYLYWSEYFNN